MCGPSLFQLENLCAMMVKREVTQNAPVIKIPRTIQGELGHGHYALCLMLSHASRRFFFKLSGIRRGLVPSNRHTRLWQHETYHLSDRKYRHYQESQAYFGTNIHQGGLLPKGHFPPKSADQMWTFLTNVTFPKLKLWGRLIRLTRRHLLL